MVLCLAFRGCPPPWALQPPSACRGAESTRGVAAPPRYVPHPRRNLGPPGSSPLPPQAMRPSSFPPGTLPGSTGPDLLRLASSCRMVLSGFWCCGSRGPCPPVACCSLAWTSGTSLATPLWPLPPPAPVSSAGRTRCPDSLALASWGPALRSPEDTHCPTLCLLPCPHRAILSGACSRGSSHVEALLLRGQGTMAAPQAARLLQAALCTAGLQAHSGASFPPSPSDVGLHPWGQEAGVSQQPSSVSCEMHCGPSAST